MIGSAELGDMVTRRLAAAGCVAAEDEAAELVSKAAGVGALEQWLRRREHGEPLAWIVGESTFCGHRVAIDPGVYVPRPQSEELARRAARLLSDPLSSGRPARPGRAADLCTGSGAVAVHLMAEVPSALVVGVDVDPVAAGCARRNGVPAVRGRLGAPLRGGAFDVVTAIAPYVPTEQMHLLPADVWRWEPVASLDGGPDGLDVVRQVVVDAIRLLRPGGWLLVEVGGDQDRALRPFLADRGFDPDAIVAWADEDGDLRGVAARVGLSEPASLG
jgi:release factor glutamine methyltransferase